MTKMKIGNGDWIVVCDGRKALILENLGDRVFPNLHTKEVHEHPDMSTSAQGSDAPGRVHQSMGGARSSIEQTDWHDESERTFLKTLAERLNVAVTTGETTALTMVASPRALGMIRSDYSVAVRKALHGDWTRIPSGCRCTKSRNSYWRERWNSGAYRAFHPLTSRRALQPRRCFLAFFPNAGFAGDAPASCGCLS